MDNKEELELKEVRNIMMDILKDIDNFCNENHITYFLACGTLLGAIKYGGFIPWDDDIDIMMPRPDFEKFNKEYKNRKYCVLTPNDGHYFYSKVYDRNTIVYSKGIDQKKHKQIGVNIDVFPLDGIVNDEEIVKKQKANSDFLEALLNISNQPIFYRKNKLKAINRICTRIIGSKRIVKLIERNAKKYDYSTSDYVIRYRRTPNGFTGALPKSVYAVDKHSFEGEMFNVPKEYDLWLKRFFGENYMTYEPPVEERRTHDRIIKRAI